MNLKKTADHLIDIRTGADRVSGPSCVAEAALSVATRAEGRRRGRGNENGNRCGKFRLDDRRRRHVHLLTTRPDARERSRLKLVAVLPLRQEMRDRSKLTAAAATHGAPGAPPVRPPAARQSPTGFGRMVRRSSRMNAAALSRANEVGRALRAGRGSRTRHRIVQNAPVVLERRLRRTPLEVMLVGECRGIVGIVASTRRSFLPILRSCVARMEE